MLLQQIPIAEHGRGWSSCCHRGTDTLGDTLPFPGVSRHPGRSFGVSPGSLPSWPRHCRSCTEPGPTGIPGQMVPTWPRPLE